MASDAGAFDLSWKAGSLDEEERFQEGFDLEYLIANGIGGYASSTAVVVNTRAYHGLLVGAMKPPVERTLLLSSLDEEVVAGNASFHLSNHQYPGAIYPEGYRMLEEFSVDPIPRWRYRAGGIEVEKTVSMIRGENTTIVSYSVEGDCLLRIRPLVTCRSFHAPAGRPELRTMEIQGGVSIECDVDLAVISDWGRFVLDPHWYYNLEYEIERRRGLAWREDLLSPGSFEVGVEGEASFSVMASIDRAGIACADAVADTTADAGAAAMAERARLIDLSAALDSQLRPLARAADSFIVRRGDGLSIIAGYHWFDDWGRDAMISLPGLLLVPGRYKEARDVLNTFARAMLNGVMPNDLGALSYNTADASLLFIHAFSRYYSYSGDGDAVRMLWPTLSAIVEAYRRGTDVAWMDSDGLISCRAGMTWMDARVDGACITPREGKPCEINALWYGALCIMERLAHLVGESWDASLAKQVKRSYRRFWNPGKDCLFDLIDPLDAAIRPNQVIAASNSFDLISRDRRKAIVDKAEIDLLTPYGLRTLSPDDPTYAGRYEGGPRERDSAYHQGTVWPWLIGPFVEAHLAASRHSARSKKEAEEMLRPLLAAGEARGSIAEVYDGDLPHRPGGCFSQAWSVAEVMRAWHEGVMERGP